MHYLITDHFTARVVSSSWLSTKLKEEITKMSAESLLRIISGDRALYEIGHVTGSKFKEMGVIAQKKSLQLIQPIVRHSFSKSTSTKMKNRNRHGPEKGVALGTNSARPWARALATQNQQSLYEVSFQKLMFYFISCKSLNIFVFLFNCGLMIIIIMTESR